MRIIADLHVHTKYSRATSPRMNLPTMAMWARRKGIGLLGTGDFTHPGHFAAIEEQLALPHSNGNGLFVLKGKEADDSATRFMLTAEVSNIYKQGDKTRKIHSLLFAPSIEAARKINKTLAGLGNIASDGRPIFGFSAKDLIKLTLEADPTCMLIPAHAWTPWFSIFGSKSGFDSIEECFGEYAPQIHAIETGLSSNPEMNRRVSALDNITLISNSDAHSPSKLGREANVLDCDLDYRDVTRVIKEGDPKEFLFTVEFFPEEGKYHFDGHRSCGVRLTPEETLKAEGLCPECGSGVTVGVSSRVEELCDRPETGEQAPKVPSRALVPLQEIIAEALGRGYNTKGVGAEYKRITDASTEFSVLLDLAEEELLKIAAPRVVEGILKVRRGELSISPGFDGEFGLVKIFTDDEKAKTAKAKTTKQMGLL